jgi:hypothetical protein
LYLSGAVYHCGNEKTIYFFQIPKHGNLLFMYEYGMHYLNTPESENFGGEA